MTFAASKKVAVSCNLKRIENLLRLAAPASGTSEHERASAALEAARLIAEHDLTVVPKETVKVPIRRERTRTKTTSTPHGRRYPGPPWYYCNLGCDVNAHCDACGGHIERGAVWMRSDGPRAIFRHAGNGPCPW